VAHYNGAGLLFTSVKEKTLRDQVRRRRRRRRRSLYGAS